jgi:hypothetical protein
VAGELVGCFEVGLVQELYVLGALRDSSLLTQAGRELLPSRPPTWSSARSISPKPLP